MANSILALKRELFKAGETIEAATLLMSEAFLNYANSVISSITERYGLIKLKIENDPLKDHIAYTDDHKIVTNVGYPLFKGKAKLECFKLTLGCILHETLHCVFTNFKLLRESQEELIRESNLYPEPREGELNKKAAETYEWLKSSKKGGRFIPVYNHFDNCIEDGYIETRGAETFPGLVSCLSLLRGTLSKDYKSLEELKKTKADKVSILLSLVLSHATTGTTKGDVEKMAGEGDEIAQKFLVIRPMVDRAVAEKDSMERKRIVNTAFLELLSLLKEVVESEKKDEEKSKSSSDKKEAEPRDGSETSEGEEPKDGSEASKDEESEDGSEASEDEEPRDGSEASEDEESEDGSEVSSSSVDPDELADVLDKFIKEEREEPVEHKNTGEPKAEPTDSLSSDSEHGEGELDKLAKDLEEDEIKKVVYEGKYKEVLRKVQECINNAKSKSPMYADTHGKAQLMERSDGRILWQEHHKRIESAARRATQILQREITERELGDVDTGYWQGQQFTSSEAWRRDRKCMSRVDVPDDRPNMEVVVLVDESGSMAGDEIEAARECAYFTYKTCEMLQIPCTVIGHDIYDRKESCLRLDVAASPEMLDGGNEERIFALMPKSNNMDGFAIRSCIDLLKKREADQKYLFVISDGAPLARGYYGKASWEDVRDAVKNGKKAGLNIVTAGIGDSVYAIKKVWLEGVSKRDAAAFLEIGI